MDTTTGAIDERPSFQLGPDTPIVIGQDPVVNPTYMGGYDQIATNDSTFFSSWADNRDGNSFHAHQPDVRLARIDHSAPVTDADVGVTVKAVPATVAEGETTTLRVKTTATGNSARDVFVSLAPPNGLEFQSVGGGSSCRLISGFVGCSLGTIPAGTTATRSVVALGTHAGDRTATARATTSDNDANQANNAGAAPVIVNPGPTVTQTFSTGDISVPITDATTVDVPLSVTPNRAIHDVDARMRLNHTFDGDLEISLVSPGGGTVVTMSDNNGGTGEDYGTGTNDCAGSPTTFDDEAATPITAGIPPFAGSFSPAPGSLSDMDGQLARGAWNLRVADQGGGDVGTIGCFELTIVQARRGQ
jgi:subtilisin-like proprotein convertase family protein